MKIISPVKGILKRMPDGIIAQYFGEDPVNYATWGLLGHNGLDLATFFKNTIMASHNGEVISVVDDPYHTLGKNIWILSAEENNKYIVTVYGHLENIVVKLGNKVVAGQKIGEMGNTGNVRSDLNRTGIHLHFGIYEYSDPLPNTFQINFNGKTYTILNHNNGYKGAIDPLLFIAEDNMLQIIGNKQNNKQYIQGRDGLLHWIFNESILNTLDSMGIIDKTKVDWKVNLDNLQIDSPIALIK